MKVLLIYPQYPDSFWGFRHSLRFISKKAAVPPLGLITVAALLPLSWEKKLVDMNVSTLHASDIQWADYVLISAMHIQKESVSNIMAECLKYGVKIIAGGPLFTQEYQSYPQISHFILNEAEITLPPFLSDLENGSEPRHVYQTSEYADLSQTPVPDYSLLSRKDYAFMNIQVSRGCPYACDFCEITALLGRKVRLKSPGQVLQELDKLYSLNWRGNVLIVDDNFIGNKNEIKNHMLPAMIQWMQDHKYPFTFNTETTITLADDEELMSLMVKAGFNSTFVGIETTAEDSLQECNKVQNKNRDLLQSVKKIQKAGITVSGGFIVGFDSDTPGIFQQQIDFIQQSGIVSAMVGLLNAPKNTNLYKRLQAENRIIKVATGNNTDSSMNFIPKMNYHELMEGYKNIIRNIYSTKPYYKRIRRFLLDYERKGFTRNKMSYSNLKAFFRSILIIGILDKGRFEYWKLFFWTIFRRPGSFTDAITFAVYGYHYRIVFGLR